jgi:hypothetical protein
MTRLFFVVFLLTGERAAADGVVVTDPRTDQCLSVGWAGGDIPGVWVSYFDGKGRSWLQVTDPADPTAITVVQIGGRK